MMFTVASPAKTPLLRVVVSTRWLRDGALSTSGPSRATVKRIFDKPRRSGESDGEHVARVHADAAWYVDTPSPYYRGSTVTVERRDAGAGGWRLVEEVGR